MVGAWQGEEDARLVGGEISEPGKLEQLVRG